MIQSTASLIADVDGELELNATASGPVLRLRVEQARGDRVQRLVPGDPLPARVRVALGTRCAAAGAAPARRARRSAGAALPFTHIARPSGGLGSG